MLEDRHTPDNDPVAHHHSLCCSGCIRSSPGDEAEDTGPEWTRAGSGAYLFRPDGVFNVSVLGRLLTEIVEVTGIGAFRLPCLRYDQSSRALLSE